MDKKKQSKLERAINRSRKLGPLVDSGDTEAQSGTASTVLHLKVGEYLQNLQDSHARRGRQSGEARSKDEDMFRFLDRLDSGEETEPRYYARTLQEKMGVGRSQAFEYVRRWREQKQ